MSEQARTELANALRRALGKPEPVTLESTQAFDSKEDCRDAIASLVQSLEGATIVDLTEKTVEKMKEILEGEYFTRLEEDIVMKGLREKYGINAENSRASDFLYAPSGSKFSEWKFPVKDGRQHSYKKDLVLAAVRRLHSTSPAVRRVVEPRLRSLISRLGLREQAPSLFNSRKKSLVDSINELIGKILGEHN